MSETKPRRDHERSDWNMSYVLLTAILFAVSVTVLCAGAWWIFRQLHASAAARHMGTARENAPPPPNPKLQVAPSADWEQMIATERTFLNSYGWIDRSQGIVHIPIRRAMDLMVERSAAEGAKAAQR